jgi:hypothetical protein
MSPYHCGMPKFLNFLAIGPAVILLTGACSTGNGSEAVRADPVDSGPTSAETACGVIAEIDELYNSTSADFDEWWSGSVSASARLAGVLATWQEDRNSDLYVEASALSRDFSSILGFLAEAPTTVEESDRFIELTEEFPEDIAAAVVLCQNEGF